MGNKSALNSIFSHFACGGAAFGTVFSVAAASTMGLPDRTISSVFFDLATVMTSTAVISIVGTALTYKREP